MAFLSTEYSTYTENYGVATASLFFTYLFRQYVYGDVKLFPFTDQTLMRTVQFVTIGFTCTLPRMYIDATSAYPYTNNYTYLRSKESGAEIAIFYIWAETFLPEGLQLCWQLFPNIVGGPDYRTIAGLEFTAVSILAREMHLPFAGAFLLCISVGLFVHQPIRRFWNGAVSTDLPARMRVNLAYCATTYLALHVLGRYTPQLLRLIMAAATAAYVLYILVTQSILMFFWDRLETKATCLDDAGKLVYKELESATSFRLLRIRPSIHLADPVRCELLEVPSVSEALNTYLAVSYRWDTSVGKTSRIIVNGEDFMVYPNLERILKDLRAMFWSELVWIDQLCINQEDATERANQVAMMDDIYEACSRVQVHLPVHGDDLCGFWQDVLDIGRPENAFPERREVDAAVDLIWKIGGSKLLQEYAPNNNEGSLLTFAQLQDWRALEKFLDNPWLNRIWVVQEVAMADMIFIQYGHRTFDWDELVRAMAVLARTDLRQFRQLFSTIESTLQEDIPAIENVLIMESMREATKRLSLFENLMLCQRFQSTDKVDKVFALLNVSSLQDPTLEKIRIDYVSSHDIIFTRVAIALLDGASVHQQYRVLRFAGLGRSDIPNLPSWAPDWSVRLTTGALEHRNRELDFAASSIKEYSATGAVHTYGTQEQNVLRIRGYNIDRISLLVDVSEIPDDNSSATPFIDARGAAQEARTPYFTQQTQEEVFWRTIVADTHPHQRPAPEEHWRYWKSVFTQSDILRTKQRNAQEEETFKELCRMLQFTSSTDLIFTHLLATDLSKHRRDQGGNFAAVLNRSYDYSFKHDPRATQGRQFCVTEKGYMALVPRHSRKGDCVVILHGAKTPHVLREDRLMHCDDCDDELQCYQLVGEAYVHGLMRDNEDLLANETVEDFNVV